MEQESLIISGAITIGKHRSHHHWQTSEPSPLLNIGAITNAIMYEVLANNG